VPWSKVGLQYIPNGGGWSSPQWWWP
jgi:hypothetical protein